VRGLNRSLPTIAQEELLPYLRTPERRREVHRFFEHALLRRLAPMAGVDTGELRFVFETSDLYVGRSTYMAGHFDLADMRTALGVAADVTGHDAVAGKTFIDVGANIGTTSIQACRLFGAARSIAFEPDSTNTRLLKANVILNDLESEVTIVPAAASDRATMAVLDRSDTNSGDHRVRLDVAGDITPTISCVTVDGWLAEHADDVDLQEIGLLWIDTQGHEGHVLAGADALIELGVPVVIEYWPYGLRQAGSYDRLNAIIRDRFEVIVDVGETRRKGSPAIVKPNDLDLLAERVDKRAKKDDIGTHRDLVLLHDSGGLR
jgi:FkbM family methyltransferase